MIAIALRFSVGRNDARFIPPMPITMIPRFSRRFALGLGLIAATVAVNAAPKAHPNTTGWQPLFAEDFSDAVTKPGDWVFEKGVMVAKNHETVWTKTSYSNFVLDLEFKVAKESNSGVFLRSGDIKNTLAALEIQVHDSADGALYGMVGAIYNAQPPAKKMSKPIGEWNRFTITCNGSHVALIFNGEEVFDALIFNGEEVFDADLNNWQEPKKNPDGTANKFGKALKDFSRSGPIGFQGLHGKAQAPVWYRNLKIRELP